MNVLLCVEAVTAVAAEHAPLLVVLARVIGLGGTVVCVAVSLLVMMVLLARGQRKRRGRRLSLLLVAIQLHDFTGFLLSPGDPTYMRLVLLFFLGPLVFTLCPKR